MEDHQIPPAGKRYILDTEQMKNRPYLSATEAASHAGVVLSTVVNWTARYPDLGVKVAGRWRINPTQLQRILEGQQPLRNSR